MTDSQIIDEVGTKDYYKHKKRQFVWEHKKTMSQSNVKTALNKWLKAEGQQPVSLSYVKKYWNK